MNKKIFILLFFMSVLISVSAVSAVDLDDNNGTIALSNDADALSIANDVNAIDDLNENDSDGDVKFVAAGKDNENNLLSVNNDENENILKDDEADFEELKKEIGVTDPEGIVLKHKYYKIDEGYTLVLSQLSHIINGNGATIDMNGNDFALFSAMVSHFVGIGNLTIKNMDSEHDRGVVLILDSRAAVKNCTFVNNRASLCGGAILVSGSEHCEITGCTFVNNIGNESGAIHFNDYSKNCKIENCAFVNNSASGGKSAIGGNIGSTSLNDNWWGSNNPDWQDLINAHAPSGYAVLICSIDTPSIAIGSKAKLTYAFYRNGTADMLPIPARPIKLSATGGKLDDDSGNLVNGEFTTEFSADEVGNYEITAIVDNQEVKINVTVGYPTEINITNETIDLKANSEVATGATLTPADAGNLTYTSTNPSVAVVENGMIKGIRQGEANITVSFAGNENYTAAENKTITVTVSLNDASVVAEDMGLKVGDNCTIGYTTNPTGLNVIFVPDDSGVVIVNETTGAVTALKAGTAQITINVGGDGVYAENTTVITVTVSKISTEINVENTNLTLNALDSVDANATLTPADAGNLNFTSSDENVVQVNDGKIMAVGNGTATVTVSFNGTDKYAAAESKTIEVTVNINDASVTAKDITLTVGENATIDAVTTPEGLNIDYVLDDSGVVTVENGVVTAVKAGTAEITLTVGDNKTYTINSTTITVTVNKIDTSIAVKDKVDMKVGDSVNLNATLTPADAGNLSFKVSDDEVIIVNGRGVVTAVGEGNATVTVSFRGNDKYLPSNATIAVTVSKVAFEPEIAMENSTLTVNVPENATGNVTLTIANETFVAPIKDGVASFDLSDVPSGDYNATVSYPGDDKYAGFDVVCPVSIEDDFVITAEDLTKYYHGPERFVVNLTDSKGNPIAGAKLSITINGQKYDRTTNEDGKTSIGVNLNSGEYPVVVSYNGTSVDAKVTVLTTVNGTDLVKVFRNATQYYATFRDSEGNYLKEGTLVTFNIHGVFYDRKISENGLTKLNINLEPGKYIITAINNVTGEQSSNNITVLSRITENNDVTKYYRNATQYTAKIIGDDGNPVGAGENVTFNINGVFYQRQTDANGIVKLNINLEPGDYIITAEYKGCMVANNIKVLPILNATDLTKKYGAPDQFVATLVDGQGKPFANQTLTFNINGVMYNRITGDDGIACLNINLMPGEYIITSMYSNGVTIANRVTVRS